MKDILFEPIMINKLEIKNRICMAAMNLNYCDENRVTDQLVEFYAERARGGAGMLVMGMATLDEYSGGRRFIGGHSDEFLPGLRKLAKGVKENGSAAFVQICHIGRCLGLSGKSANRQARAPSAIFSQLTQEMPHAVTLDEIAELIDAHAQAARRMKEAGMDGIELLVGTGYLISEFFAPCTNQRTDEYGGSLENRMRFGLDIMRAVRKMVGPDFPVTIRMNGNDFMQGGNSREETQAWAKALVSAGADALNVNVGWHEARVPQVTTGVPRGTFAYLARRIKTVVDVPVMSGHRINDPETARELISNDMCDMVCMGRPLIADPYLPLKAMTGKAQEIVHCVACGQGCLDHVFMVEKPVECLCNPRAGHELEFPAKKAEKALRVMVVGGGAAGMAAALSAAECGHSVTLYESGSRLGGQLILAGTPPGREEFKELASNLATQVSLADIRVKYNCEVDVALIDKESPDVVILATGAMPTSLPIPGVDQPHVVQAWDVLSDKVATGKRVVIVGGGAVGVETALFLADKGTLSGDSVKFLLVNQAEDPAVLYELATKGTKEIVLIEMIPAIGKGVGLTTRWTFMQDLQRAGVSMLNKTKALEITPTSVKVDRKGEISELPCDTVVLAAGVKSCNQLQESLEKKGIACHVVGDAHQVAFAMDAIHEGYKVGRQLGA
ncbi:MAG: FAD-dependent oxidoreductase [Syntrophobacteraceae bacterium]